MATYDLNNTTLDSYVTNINPTIRNEIISFLNLSNETITGGIYVESPPGTVATSSNAIVWSLVDDTLSVSPNGAIAAVIQDTSDNGASLRAIG